MKKNKQSAGRMLCSDSVLLITFGAVAIVTVYFILVQVLSFLDDAALGIALLIVAIVSMLALVGSMAEVLMYLRKNKEENFKEESYYQELIRQEKEGRHR